MISGTANNAADLVKEDSDLSATGTLTLADIDNGATATWTIEGGARRLRLARAHRQHGGGPTPWPTAPTVPTAHQTLAAGEDSHRHLHGPRRPTTRAASDQLVTITITGTNDDPVISGTANNAADLVKEDSDFSATGR